LVVAVIGVGFGMRAIDESEQAQGLSASGSAGPTMVSLDEYSITLDSVAVGGSLHVMNDGSIPHNLVIEGTGLKTDDIEAGGDATLQLGATPAGTYTVICSIPGHRESGMEAEMVVTDGEGSTAGGGESHADMDYSEMVQAMLTSMTAYPAETAGVGNPPLEPTEVLADGTKVFDVTAAITPWEVSPGKIVDAWTYNGVVPGPQIQLDVGDRVHLRFHNELPMGSDIHLHGLNVENRFDGVAPLTQPVVEPGESFTYEFVADEVAVAMYHPHFMSQESMPNGLFGTIIVGDEPLPLGRTISVGLAEIPEEITITQRIPMVLNDSGVIGYSLNGKSFPATAPIVAAEGDWILIDYFNEGSQIHPMHLHQFDQIVIAEDGFPLDYPYIVDTLNVAPGNRFTVLVQLDKPGTWVWHCHILPHVENDNGMFGMVTAVVVT
jgi:FtsP/CotA-like multicopper oxidase with cupredoxin domain